MPITGWLCGLETGNSMIFQEIRQIFKMMRISVSSTLRDVMLELLTREDSQVGQMNVWERISFDLNMELLE